MAVQMPRQSSLQVDSEQGVGRRACRSGEEGEQGVGRRDHMEWGGGTTWSVEDGLSRFAVWSVVTREEERFPEQEMFGACFRQCVVDLDLHFIFSSNNFLALASWPHFTDSVVSAASPGTPGMGSQSRAAGCRGVSALRPAQGRWGPWTGVSHGLQVAEKA